MLMHVFSLLFNANVCSFGWSSASSYEVSRQFGTQLMHAANRQHNAFSKKLVGNIWKAFHQWNVQCMGLCQSSNTTNCDGWHVCLLFLNRDHGVVLLLSFESHDMFNFLALTFKIHQTGSVRIVSCHRSKVFVTEARFLLSSQVITCICRSLCAVAIDFSSVSSLIFDSPVCITVNFQQHVCFLAVEALSTHH